MEVDRVQPDWAWWYDQAKETTDNHEQEHETDENQINYVGKGKGKGKNKGECWTCGEVGRRAAECSKGGWYGKGGKGKGGQWQATRQGDGKGSKGGWTSAMVKAFFGCGKHDPLDTRLPSQDDSESAGGQRRGGTSQKYCSFEPWLQVDDVTPRKPCAPRLQYATPPGLEEVTKMRFRVIDEDEEDEDDEETRHVRAVDSWVGEAIANWEGGQEKLGTPLELVRLFVDSAADESCWPKERGDAFSTKPSKKNIIFEESQWRRDGSVLREGGHIQAWDRCRCRWLEIPGDGCEETPSGGEEAGGEGQRGDCSGRSQTKTFLQHVQTGKKIPTEKRGGAFVIKAHFVKEVDAGFTRQV